MKMQDDLRALRVECLKAYRLYEDENMKAVADEVAAILAKHEEWRLPIDVTVGTGQRFGKGVHVRLVLDRLERQEEYNEISNSKEHTKIDEDPGRQVPPHRSGGGHWSDG